MGRIIQFFRDVRAEMTKVVWPTRQETIRYTAAVIIFSASLAILLGAFDYGIIKGLETILNR